MFFLLLLAVVASATGGAAACCSAWCDQGYGWVAPPFTSVRGPNESPPLLGRAYLLHEVAWSLNVRKTWDQTKELNRERVASTHLVLNTDSGRRPLLDFFLLAQGSTH